ncbi:MAG: hypothetical protein JW742_08400 [Candidatus Aminicenantes bacterium]|nr:hypothetical protein [Candidatus Aminicenantes bacterium]
MHPSRRQGGSVTASRPSLRLCLALWTLVLAVTFPAAAEKAAAPASPASLDPAVFAGLRARSIGPSNMSGRIGAVDGVASDPRIIWVGAAAGGLWKSVNGGTTWTPVFDDQPVASIGAIAINRKTPDEVWIGTGEAAPRNSVSVGRGVYLTRDGGRTWACLGLEKTEKISKILLHPDNPAVAYIGACGATWGDSPERGVFRTQDGGRTWKKILYVDERTGVADLAMDPSNPNRILAAMWEHRRWPWFFKSGGPGSGLYLTADGGETWKKLGAADGLPKGELGRIGVAFAPSDSMVAYALVEAEKNALYRSADGGLSWQAVNNNPDINNRPFYYCRLWVNPMNENTIYLLATQLRISEDGGKTMRNLASFNQSHSDYHAMWIHPDGNLMVVGNDGGVVISRDRGRSWAFMEGLALGQFYHVSVDGRKPYGVYGGLQDNGSWVGLGYSVKERVLYDYNWTTVGGGDGFDVEPDPERPGAGYAMSQGGSLYYFDTTTGTSRTCVPTESDVKHRFNWNAGFAVDPFQPSVVYYGSQFLHRSPDKGRTWEIISPDLTTNDPSKQKQSESGGLTLDISSAENHCTILTVSPSPLGEGVIWVGTDDGNIQLTRDGGKTWELVSGPLDRGRKAPVPEGTWVPHVEASRHDAATAYVVFDDHRRSNWTPFVFVTRDFGKTWKSLVTPEIDGYCHVIKEDSVKPDLLFLGTEFGLFLSLNGGAKWLKWTHGLPTVPVYDIALQAEESDVVIATHGRAIYVIDDIGPLREFTAEVASKKLHLFKPQDAVMWQSGRMSAYQSPGDAIFVGENKNTQACITYFLTPVERKDETPAEDAPAAVPGGAPTFGQGMPAGMAGRFGGFSGPRSRVQISILDASGKSVAQVSGPENKGINRAYWNFMEQEPGREGEAQAAAGAAFFRFRGGVTALPGEYTVKIKYEGEEATGTLRIAPDPRFQADPAVLKANHDLAVEGRKLSSALMDAQRRIQAAQKAIATAREYGRANRGPKMMDVMKAADALDKKLKALAETINPTPAKQGMADRSSGLMSQVMGGVSGLSRSGYEPVGQAMLIRYEKAKAKLAAFLPEFNAVFEKDVEAFKTLLKEAGFGLFEPFRPLKID